MAFRFSKEEPLVRGRSSPRFWNHDEATKIRTMNYYRRETTETRRHAIMSIYIRRAAYLEPIICFYYLLDPRAVETAQLRELLCTWPARDTSSFQQFRNNLEISLRAGEISVGNFSFFFFFFLDSLFEEITISKITFLVERDTSARRFSNFEIISKFLFELEKFQLAIFLFSFFFSRLVVWRNYNFKANFLGRMTIAWRKIDALQAAI